jgi:hypothetical protein
MLPFHLLLNLANGCFPRGLSTKILCTPCQVIIPIWLGPQNIKLIHELITLPSFNIKQLLIYLLHSQCTSVFFDLYFFGNLVLKTLYFYMQQSLFLCCSFRWQHDKFDGVSKISM